MMGKLIPLLFVPLALGVMYIAIQRIQNPETIQENPEAAAVADFPKNEKAFVTHIWNTYIGGKTETSLASTFSPARTYAIANTGSLNSYYRALCTQATMTAIAKEGALTASEPYVRYFQSSYDSSHINTIMSSGQDAHVQGASLFDCLIAINALRSVVPETFRNTVLGDIKTHTLSLHTRLRTWNGTTYSTVRARFEGQAAANAGDTQAEEAMIAASLFTAAAELLPQQGTGFPDAVSLGATDKSALIATASDLAAWGITRGSTTSSIQNPAHWLVNNHQMSPSPIYTLSLLTGYAEMRMIYSQLGRSIPTAISNASLSTAFGNIAVSLDAYTDTNFRFKGIFNTIDWKGTPDTNFRYETMRYSLVGAPVPAGSFFTNSSAFFSRIDSMNQFLVPNTDTLKSYILTNDRLWSYTCDVASGYCAADYQIETLSEFFSSIQRKTNNADGWNTTVLPNRVDTLMQWFKDNTTLMSYIYSGDRVWHYICYNVGQSGSYCQAEYTRTLGSHWPSGIGPSTRVDIDAISEFVVPGTNTLKGYVYEGGTMWAYTCDRLNYPGSCVHNYSKSLSEFWQGVTNQTAWSGFPPPTNAIDSIHQYYYPTGTLKTYVTHGDRIWAYTCTTSCSAFVTQTINENLTSVNDQYKWPMFIKPAEYVSRTGVSDWGMDGTFQNSAYTALYLVNPTQHSDRYGKLQDEQLIVRRRTTELPFPSNFASNAWNHGAFISTKNTTFLLPLTDGWRYLRGDNGRQVSLTQYNDAPSIDVKTNTHWWLNILAGKNHSVAYIALTGTKVLGSFVQPSPTPTITPTQTPTRTPTPVPPTSTPTRTPTRTPTPVPPTATPTRTPTPLPPTSTPTRTPTPVPPTSTPTRTPTPVPPTATPTRTPTPVPPTSTPTRTPTPVPPTSTPTWTPTPTATIQPPTATPIVSVSGDTNGDGRVNLTDLLNVLSSFGKAVPAWTQGDVDGNGLVNSFDLTIVLSNFGK